MVDPKIKTGEPHVDGDFDQELSYRGIGIFIAAIGLLTVLTFVFSWHLDGGLKRYLAHGDPEPSPLAEARVPRVPPSPHLQTLPYEDLVQMHAIEDRVLHSYGMVDPGAAKIRIPIDEAMSRVARGHLPHWPKPSPEGGQL